MMNLTVSFAAEDAPFVVPMGLAMPAAAPMSFTATGATLEMVAAPGVQQMLALGRPTDARVTLRYRFAAEGAAYPEAVFQPVPSRFTQAAAALSSEARLIAEDAGGGAAGLRALIDHVAELFDYGHTDDQFYEGEAAIPQLCGLTQGSCVDINVYLVAALRAAGIEAGYVTGFFIPAEKRTHTSDMHCWVVTRMNGVVQDWDIAHHLKMGRRDVAPGLNPKPGVRVALAHSMGWDVPALGVVDHKLMAHPQWVRGDGLDWITDIDVTFDGYGALEVEAA